MHYVGKDIFLEGGVETICRSAHICSRHKRLLRMVGQSNGCSQVVSGYRNVVISP